MGTTSSKSKTKPEVAEVDASPARSEAPTSNAAFAEDMGAVASSLPMASELGMVDMNRAEVVERFYQEAYEAVSVMASEPSLAQQQSSQETDSGLEEDSTCEELDFESFHGFFDLVTLWGRALVEIDDPIFPEFEESILAAADATGGGQSLHDAIVAARREAEASAVCDPDMELSVQDHGPPPIDAFLLADYADVCPLEPEQEPAECVVEPLPTLAVCEPMAIESTVPEALPALPGVDAVYEYAPEELAALDGTLGFSEQINAEVPPSGFQERLADVAGHTLDSSIGPFTGAFLKNMGDALVLDTLGQLGDSALAKRLASGGNVAGSKIPVVGPVISLVLFGSSIARADSPQHWSEEFFKDFYAANADRVDYMEELSATWSSLTAGEGWETAVHALNTQAELASGMGNLAGGLGALAGLVSALSFVAAFAATCTGVGAAFAPALVLLGQQLATAASVLGLCAIGNYALSSLFRVLAAGVAPTEMYDSQIKLLEESVSLTSEKSGGFAGDQMGSAIATEVQTTWEARSAARAEGDAPHNEGPEGAEAGRQQADSELETAKQSVDEHGDALIAHADKADGHAPTTDAPAPSIGKRVLTRWANNMASLGGLRETAADRKAASEAARSDAQTLEDHPSQETLQGMLDKLKTDMDSGNESMPDLEQGILDTKAELAAFNANPSESIPADSDFVSEITRLNAAVKDAELDLRTAQRDSERAQENYKEIGVLLFASKIRETEGSSGNATGGTGSAYLATLEEAISWVGALQKEETTMLGQLRDFLLHLADTSESIDQMVDDVCMPEDTDGSAAYYAEHGDEIQEEIDAMLAAKDHVQVLVEPANVDVQQMLDSGDDMSRTRYEFFVDQSAGYSFGMLEAAALEADSLLLPESMVEDLTDRADSTAAQIDESLAGTAEAQAQLGEAAGKQEAAPDGVMSQLEEAQSLLGDDPALIDGGVEVEVPGVAVEDMNEAGEQSLAQETERLAEQSSKLSEQRASAAAAKEAIAEPMAQVAAQRADIQAAGDSAASAKAESISSAESSRASAEAAADMLITDLATLEAQKAKQAGTR